MNQSLSTALAKAMAYDKQRPALLVAGVQALNRLVPVALNFTSEGRAVGRFLLGLYNGEDFPFDLTELRGLDLALFEDCLAVLMMDYSPEVEVHERLEHGSAIWQRLMEMWAPEVVDA
ncbi:DUF7673 family protein [uncultured Pseudomonas sp.]|uniref:DUF7673 family protein n=1 Tax=uncultured Pseudomonas sp. TaxID=114707 RepID=UPI0025DE10C4|nr:hypothetical protein [uncultured Pseudomonas sp.]